MKRTLTSSKSRRGCKRCKIQKIKCDETRPACQACLKACLECPGFAPQYKWSSKHEKFGPLSRNQETSKAMELQDRLSGTHVAEEVPAEDQVPTSLYASPDDGESCNNAALPVMDIASLSDLDANYEDLSFLDMEILDQFDLSPTSDPLEASVDETTVGLAEFDQGLFPFSQVHQESQQNQSPVTNAPRMSHDRQSNSKEHVSNKHARRSSLLATFYRIASPTPVAQFSDKDLIDHYFESVCSLCSCFDSPLNPFRFLVSNMYQNSVTISLAIQSMAITHLSNHYLYLAPLGRVKRWQSWKFLQRDLQLHRANKIPLDQVLMSLLLLGLFSSWHHPSSLGLEYLFLARNLMQNYLHESQNRTGIGPSLENEEFFSDALMYWEMLASFIDPVPMVSFPGFGAPTAQIAPEQQCSPPHSLTGIGSELHFALGEVGRILRRGVTRTSPFANDGNETKRWCLGDVDWAVTLEAFVHSVQIPLADEIPDYGDVNTPKFDLVRVADAYRYLCLLEIYWAFPFLLQDKISKDVPFPPLGGDAFDLQSAHPSSYINETHAWLCALSLQTLAVTRAMSMHSAACRALPLVLISCASQLRVPSRQTSVGTDESQDGAVLDVVLEARYLVESRMLALSRKYPQRRLFQMLDIIKEVWQRLETNEGNSHWLDVAHEKGWQTMMG